MIIGQAANWIIIGHIWKCSIQGMFVSQSIVSIGGWTERLTFTLNPADFTILRIIYVHAARKREASVTSTYLRRRGVIFPFTISEVRTIMIHEQFNRAILSRDLRRFTPPAFAPKSSSRSQPLDKSLFCRHRRARSLWRLFQNDLRNNWKTKDAFINICSTIF